MTRTHKEGWEKLREKAEYFLAKASHEGDAVQQSFASLAYAYCPFRRYGDNVGFHGAEPFPASKGREVRLSEHRARLIDTYNRFKTLVSERALLAAFQLVMVADYEKRVQDENHWRAIIQADFGSLRAWYSYHMGYESYPMRCE